MPDLLIQAMTAKQNGDFKLAKQLLSQVLIQNPRNEAAWMLMSEAVSDVNMRRDCLQRVLSINPGNTAASIALTKLDTSPLAPVTRGERNKPLNPPNLEKAPPFTWEGEPEQYPPIGELTFPDLSGEKTDQPLETPSTFDWANDSEEPDKAIQKIFDAISNPELAAQPLPDTDLSSSDKKPTEEQTGSTTVDRHETEARWLDELVGPTPEAIPDQQLVTGEETTVSSEPRSGSEDITPTEPTAITPAESEYLLWDNPKAKLDRLVILGNKSIIYANPSPSDIPHILGLFAENKMVRDLLGENTGTIKLESIQRVSANLDRKDLNLVYRKDESPASQVLTFTSRQVRDEALSAIEQRLGSNVSQTTHSFSLKKKILAPLLIILLVAAFGWLLIAGLPLLSGTALFQSGTPQVILYNLQHFVDILGDFNLLSIAVILIALCLIWLISNLSKPSKMVILERK